MDTFDPKPALDKYNGQDPGKMFTVEPTQFNTQQTLLASPWKFQSYGESGIPVSDLFPNVATCVDELAVIRSMVSEFPEHTFANYFLHTGSGLQTSEHGRLGELWAWSECQNLPGFVVINGGLIHQVDSIVLVVVSCQRLPRFRIQAFGKRCCEH